MQWIYIILVAVCNSVATEETRPLLTTPLGRLRGSFYQSLGGRQYAAFEGIPYAKPPVKKNRFREPRPVKQWEGVLEARFLYTCIQYNHYISMDKDRVIGDEDCLYLNVYTPNVHPDIQMDVIVFIHGGAFMYGSGQVYGERILMDRNVVYVTLNYRLGPFGKQQRNNNCIVYTV
ncbi:Juvenile hormone esterase duplication [Carabus blaptoides fortunei]